MSGEVVLSFLFKSSSVGLSCAIFGIPSSVNLGFQLGEIRQSQFLHQNLYCQTHLLNCIQLKHFKHNVVNKTAMLRQYRYQC